MNAQTKVSAKGQVVIPKSVRDELDWPSGTRLEIERVGASITLRPVQRKGSLTMDEFIARRPQYEGRPLSLEEMDAAAAEGMAEHFGKEFKTRK